jgi:hypothetical protein
MDRVTYDALRGTAGDEVPRVRGRLLQAEMELARALGETPAAHVRLARGDIVLFTGLLDAADEPWEYMLPGTSDALDAGGGKRERRRG